MISEFHDLSVKIDQLAELTQALRRENATLRHANVLLSAENVAFMNRLGEAQRRVEALLEKMPAPMSAPMPAPDSLTATVPHDEPAQ